MSWIATCKICHERVAIPEGIDQSESVCCPLCRAEFLLSEMPPEVGEVSDEPNPPPEVVPAAALFDEGHERQSPEPPACEVDETIDESEGLVVEEEADAERDEPSDCELAEAADEAKSPPDETVPAPDEAREPVPEVEEPVSDTPETAPETPSTVSQAESMRVRCPVCDAEYGLSQVIVVSTGERLGAEAAPAAGGKIGHSGLGIAADEKPALDVWAKADGAPQIDLGGGAGTHVVTAEAGSFHFAQEGAEAADASGGTGSLPVSSRHWPQASGTQRRRNQHSGLRTLAGPVIGGIAGLVVAYYLLNWMRGEAGNFLNIPLPGVPHTYKHSPDWFPSWLKPAPESEDDPSDEIADFESRENPARPDVPPPERKTFPEGYVGLVEPPSYASDELGEALKAAHESLPDASGPISEESYRKWCRLAEVVTFVSSGPGAGQLTSRRSAVRALLQEIGHNEANLDKIGYRAGALCASEHREGNGILLAGTVVKTVSEGNAYGAQVELAASGMTILVASEKPLPAAADDAVMILGSIVDNPAENLAGFKTQRPLVVWAGLTVKVGG